MTTWRRLASYLWRYRRPLALALVSMVILAATTGLYPMLLDVLTSLLINGHDAAATTIAGVVGRLKPAVDWLGVDVPIEALGASIERHLLVLFGAVVVVKSLSQGVRFYAMGWIAQRVVQDIRRDLFGAVLRQGAAFFGEQGSGFLVSRLMNDVSQVERAATYAIPVAVGDAMKVLALGTVCLVQYPELSLVSLVVLPLAVLPIVQFGRMLKRFAKQGQESLGALTNRITETLGGMRVVQTYGREAFEMGRFDRDSDHYIGMMMKSVFVRAIQTPLMELIGVAALLLTLGYAVGRVDAGSIRPGEVVGFLLALVLLYEPLKSIGRLNGILLPGLAAAERVFEIVDRESDVRNVADARELEPPVASVRFEDVSFRYKTSERDVLASVNFQLTPGRVTALVGPSGGGKSTVAALVPRLFDVTSGSVTINGFDIRSLTIESLRSHIALVAQETYLFNDSIRENIAYGRPEASENEIIEAAKRAYAHDFITKLPAGYSSRAGERGVQLSGGQRQRIAIARAFLRDAPVVVLDEATSALDAESEREVQRALDALMERRAVLVIAHRLSTVKGADEILVIEGGKIVERGTHDELLTKDGSYARLVRMSEL